jgi:hypothetical protein
MQKLKAKIINNSLKAKINKNKISFVKAEDKVKN